MACCPSEVSCRFHEGGVSDYGQGGGTDGTDAAGCVSLAGQGRYEDVPGASPF